MQYKIICTALRKIGVEIHVQMHTQRNLSSFLSDYIVLWQMKRLVCIPSLFMVKMISFLSWFIFFTTMKSLCGHIILKTCISYWVIELATLQLVKLVCFDKEIGAYVVDYHQEGMIVTTLQFPGATTGSWKISLGWKHS